MNHSCAANVLDFGLDFGMAVRDIEPGTEVTCDYGAFSADEGWSMRCTCPAPVCRGEVSTTDYGSPVIRARWLDHLASSLPLAGRVAQPLAPLLTPVSPTFRRLLAGAITVDTVHVGHTIVAPGFRAGSS